MNYKKHSIVKIRKCVLILDEKTLFRSSAGNAAYATSFIIRKMCLIMCCGCEWLEKCVFAAFAVSLMNREKKAFDGGEKCA